jgi:hypothetical protein
VSTIFRAFKRPLSFAAPAELAGKGVMYHNKRNKSLERETGTILASFAYGGLEVRDEEACTYSD